MYQTSSLLFLYNETPLHPGSGTGIGDVDQPIQREAYTQLPVIHDSGVKGASRHDMAEARGIYELEARIKELEQKSERSDEEENELEEKLEEIKPFEAVFGPDVGTGREHEHGGALGLADARIMLFPVRSLRGLFSWVTCPFVLNRLRRDLSKVVPDPPPSANGSPSSGSALPDMLDALDALLELPMPGEGEAWASESCSARIGDDGEEDEGRIVLEDFTFSCSGGARAPHVETVGRWLGRHALPAEAGAFNHMRQRLPHSLVVVSDDLFRDFTRFSTEIVTRIRIDETGTVAEGALWNEEHLPSDCLLYSLTPAMRSRAPAPYDMGAGKVLDMFAEHLAEHSLIQFGGGKSLSRGLTQATLQTAGTLLPETGDGNAPASPSDEPTSDEPTPSQTA
jgi:CRISPR-associated protein Cmr4